MQNPEEYQFEDSYLRTKRAWLGNGEWLDIHSSIDDHRTTITVSLECFVQKFFYRTDRKEDWPAIEQIFPQEYWYGGEKQHPAITELVHTHLLAHEADQLLQEYRSNPLDRHNVSHTLTDQQANRLTYQLREAGGNREAQVKAIAHLVDVDLNRPADLDMTLREYLYMQGSDPQELKDRLIDLLYDSNGLKISNDRQLVKSISEARILKLAEQITVGNMKEKTSSAWTRLDRSLRELAVIFNELDTYQPHEKVECNRLEFLAESAIELRKSAEQLNEISNMKEENRATRARWELLRYQANYFINYTNKSGTYVSGKSYYEKLLRTVREMTELVQKLKYEQQQQASLRIDNQQSSSAAGPDPARPQAEYAAPQYQQQQQQLQQSQQAAGTQMSM